MRAFAKFYRTKNEDDFVNIFRVSHDKDVRTCKMAALSFHQSFRRIAGTGNEPTPWIAQGQPEGECAIVQLSRFVPEKPKGTQSTFWKYVARKAITNPDGNLLLGSKCVGFDEGEYLYD